MELIDFALALRKIGGGLGQYNHDIFKMIAAASISNTGTKMS